VRISARQCLGVHTFIGSAEQIQEMTCVLECTPAIGVHRHSHIDG